LLRPQGVSLHIPADAQKLFILLDRKAPEAALVEVPAPAGVAMGVPAGGSWTVPEFPATPILEPVVLQLRVTKSQRDRVRSSSADSGPLKNGELLILAFQEMPIIIGLDGETDHRLRGRVLSIELLGW
jgi:hypothetical protein